MLFLRPLSTNAPSNKGRLRASEIYGPITAPPGPAPAMGGSPWYPTLGIATTCTRTCPSTGWGVHRGSHGPAPALAGGYVVATTDLPQHWLGGSSWYPVPSGTHGPAPTMGGSSWYHNPKRRASRLVAHGPAPALAGGFIVIPSPEWHPRGTHGPAPTMGGSSWYPTLGTSTYCARTCPSTGRGVLRGNHGPAPALAGGFIVVPSP